MSGIDLAGDGLVGRDMSEEQVARALRVLRASPMAGNTIRYCRGLAAEALAALPVLQDEEMGVVLRRLPSAYIDSVERQVLLASVPSP